MSPLPTTFSVNGYRFTVLDREGPWAIARGVSNDSGCVCYEVAHVRVKPAGVLPNGKPVEERERWPSNYWFARDKPDAACHNGPFAAEQFKKRAGRMPVGDPTFTEPRKCPTCGRVLGSTATGSVA